MALQKKVRLEEGDRFAFEKKGDKLAGYYAGTDEIETTYGLSKRHAVKTNKGLTTFFGNAQVNQDLAEVPVGTYVEIVLIGTKKVKRGTMKVFDFSFDLDDVNTSAVEEREALNASESEGTEEDLADEAEVLEAEADIEEEQAKPLPASRVAKQPAKVDPARADRAREMLSRRNR